MKGVPTRFLTGTDEHSINIAQSALDEGRTPRAFVDEKVELFRSAEAALGIKPDRFIRTTDPAHIRATRDGSGVGFVELRSTNRQGPAGEGGMAGPCAPTR